jgi:hypothetical protein
LLCIVAAILSSIPHKLSCVVLQYPAVAQPN